MSTAKEAYRTAMRDDLLEAAQRVIARTGLAAVTVRAILEEAEVAPGTLYSYFSGKDEIVEAVAERVLTQYLAAIPVTGITPTEQFLSILEAVFTSPPEEAAVVAELRGRATNEDHGVVVRQLNADVVASTRPMLDRAVREEGATVDDPEALAELLDIVWDGMTRRAASDTFVTDYRRVGHLAAELLTAPLRTPPPTRKRLSSTRKGTHRR